jgi:hypothetical protein
MNPALQRAVLRGFDFGQSITGERIKSALAGNCLPTNTVVIRVDDEYVIWSPSGEVSSIRPYEN